MLNVRRGKTPRFHIEDAFAQFFYFCCRAEAYFFEGEGVFFAKTR